MGILSPAHYARMVGAAKNVIERECGGPDNVHLVSGGAAWSDHLVITLVKEGYVSKDRLTIFSPCNLEYWGFEATGKGERTASTLNYYHKHFSSTLGYDTVRELYSYKNEQCDFRYCEDNFFVRNAMLAHSLSVDDLAIAFTTGDGKSSQRPWTARKFDGSVLARDSGLKDGGTAHTWDRLKCTKMHVLIGKVP